MFLGLEIVREILKKKIKKKLNFYKKLMYYMYKHKNKKYKKF